MKPNDALSDAIRARAKQQKKIEELDVMIESSENQIKAINDQLERLVDLDDRIAVSSAEALRHGDAPELSRKLLAEKARKAHLLNVKSMVEAGARKLQGELDRANRDMAALSATVKTKPARSSHATRMTLRISSKSLMRKRTS